MKRRALLSGIGVFAAGSFTGCLADGGRTGDRGDGGGTGSDDNGGGAGDGDAPGERDTGTVTEQTPGNETATTGDGTQMTSPPRTAVRLIDSTLTTTDGGCGQQVDSATVTFKPVVMNVLVTGTIWGSDACKIPTLTDANYDAQADELSVTVTATDPDTDETPMCAQCIVELDYRATFSFEGGVPGSVAVRHDHGAKSDVVTTATRA